MEKQERKLTVDATLTSLDEVVGFVEDSLSTTSCPMKLTMQVALCIEELFVNVASYAYENRQGVCTIRLETQHTDTDGIVFIELPTPESRLIRWKKRILILLYRRMNERLADLESIWLKKVWIR